jgi:hypothetical protein
LANILLYLTKGSLPWENFKGKDTLENLRFVTEKKESTKIEALTKGLQSKNFFILSKQIS